MSLAEDLAACDVEIVKAGGLKAFVEIAWPKVYPNSPLSWNWHLDMLCEHYEAGFRGQIPELVVNLPPGGSKSSLTSVFFPAWGWIKDPGSSWIFTAYGQKIVRRDAEYWKQLVQSPWYQARWGAGFQIPTVPAIDLIKNNKGGFRLGSTPGGEVTGFHANVQVFDDPNKPEELTPVGLANTKDWASRTMSTRWRRPPAVNFLCCIMQRLHCDDLSQVFLDRGALHICLPAQFDPDRRTVTTWGKDPRMKRGELMDPVRLPESLIKSLRQTLGPMNASAQLDQNPVPEGGATFKKASLRFWSTNPRSVTYGVQLEGGTKCLCVDFPMSWDEHIASWDMAFKDLEANDRVVGQAWGRVGSGMYLLGQRRGHFDFPESCRQVVQLRREFPKATLTLVEDKANGSAVISTLKNAFPGLLAVTPEGGKESRASAASGLVEAGNIFLPDPGMPGFAWVAEELLPELLSFPRSKNDDQVDAMSQACAHFVQHTSYLKAAMDRVRQMMGRVDVL